MTINLVKASVPTILACEQFAADSVAQFVCGQCGGQGYISASSFGEYGWHPCYSCGTSGRASWARVELRGSYARRSEHVWLEMESTDSPLVRYYV